VKQQKYFPSTPGLKASVSDGKAHAVMLGAGETYLAVFIIFLGATNLQVGVLATLPALLGALFQRAGVWVMERFNHRRAMLTSGALVQALTWFSIALVPFFVTDSSRAVTIVILIFSLYFIISGLIAPAWNSLIGDMIPPEERGTFFGYRTQQTSIYIFASLLAAGLLIGISEGTDYSLLSFTFICLVAAVARFISVFWFMRHDNPPFAVSIEDRFSFWDFLKRSRNSNFARFVFFLAAMNFAGAIAFPYFTPYMLNDLGFSFIEFTAITSAMILAQFLTLRNWGSLSNSFGYRRIIGFCSWGIAIIPFFWLISGSFWYLVSVQLISGVMWAGYNLSAANFLFDAVSPPKRGRCAAYMGIINGIAIFAGSMAGGFLARGLPESFSLSTIGSSVTSTLLLLFLISGVLRLLGAYFFLNRFVEVRDVEATTHRELVIRIAHLRPLHGMAFRPVNVAIRKTIDKTREIKNKAGKKQGNGKPLSEAPKKASRAKKVD